METVALVGPSGSGKSQRAVIIASELNTPYIIDDGLFIKNDTIVAGHSAKAEATKIAAVRRALFFDSEHARSVRQAISCENPEKILILATSKAMAERIASELRLPQPESYLMIEDVVPEKEIQAAIKARKSQGRHVVPVPTMEMKKTFTGYLINPLRLLYRGGRVRDPLMIEKSLVRPPFSSMGKFFVSDRVLMQIAAYSVNSIEGLSSLSPPVITMRDGQVILSVTCRVNSEMLSFDFLADTQKIIRDKVQEMTTIEVASVNLGVNEIDIG